VRAIEGSRVCGSCYNSRSFIAASGPTAAATGGAPPLPVSFTPTGWVRFTAACIGVRTSALGPAAGRSVLGPCICMGNTVPHAHHHNSTRVFTFLACSSGGGAAEPQQQRGSWLTGGWLRLPGSDPSDAGAGGAGRGGSGGSSGGGLFGLGGSHGTAGAPFAGRGRTIGDRQTEMIGAAEDVFVGNTLHLCKPVCPDAVLLMSHASRASVSMRHMLG
jgi:hypothetical protein